MKKTFIFLLIMVLVLVGCSNKDSKSTENESNANVEESESIAEESEAIDVDNNLFSVEVTLPASMFEGEDIDEIIAGAKEEGIKEVIKNDNGSITYKMSKSHYKEMITEMREEIISGIEEMKSDSDYVSIKDITYNDSFSEFTMVVNKEDFENSFDSFAAFGLGMQGMYYQIFDGVSEDDTKVSVFIKDVDTEEIIDTIIYPDSLNSEE